MTHLLCTDDNILYVGFVWLHLPSPHLQDIQEAAPEQSPPCCTRKPGLWTLAWSELPGLLLLLTQGIKQNCKVLLLGRKAKKYVIFQVCKDVFPPEYTVRNHQEHTLSLALAPSTLSFMLCFFFSHSFTESSSLVAYRAEP